MMVLGLNSFKWIFDDRQAKEKHLLQTSTAHYSPLGKP